MFGTVPGEVAVGVVAYPLRRGRISFDVVVFAPTSRSARAACCLSAKPKRDKGIGLPCHLERLHRPASYLP